MNPKDRIKTFDLIISLGIIAVVSAIVYLPLINSFGFIRDDWYLIWSGYTHGPQKIVEIFSTDRPVLGLIYSWTYSLLGNQPLGWNIFSFIFRLLGFWGTYWILSLLWPKRNYANTMITLLVVVYPGFLQQPNANTFSNLIMAFFFSIISIALSILALKMENRLIRIALIVLSSILTLGYLMIAEYLIGMEAVRFILVYFTVAQRSPIKPLKYKLTRVIFIILPNMLITLLMVIWRLFFFTSDRPAVNVDSLFESYSSSPIYNTLRLIVEFFKDQLEIIAAAWTVPFYNLTSQTRLKEILIGVLLSLVVLVVILIYYYYNRKNISFLVTDNRTASIYARDYLVIGILCVAVTSLPVIISNRNVLFQSNWDRYTLQSSFGAALILYGLISYIHKEWPRVILYSILVSLAVTTHYLNSVRFRDIWEAQRQMWWQFSWRAPQIEPETVLVGSIYQYGYEEDYELWAPANLIYYPDSKSPTIRNEVLNQQTTKNILSSFWDSGATRTIEYERDYENTLVFNIPSPFSCLHLMDGNNTVVSEYAESDIQAIAPFSKISRIITDQPPPQIPNDIFGDEPEHSWCYYFQKASLALQMRDYKEVVRLGYEVKKSGLKPSDWYEWLPFIEGYTYMGEYDEAKKLIPIIRELPYVKYQTCRNLENEHPVQNQEASEFLFQNICVRK